MRLLSLILCLFALTACAKSPEEVFIDEVRENTSWPTGDESLMELGSLVCSGVQDLGRYGSKTIFIRVAEEKGISLLDSEFVFDSAVRNLCPELVWEYSK